VIFHNNIRDPVEKNIPMIQNYIRNNYQNSDYRIPYVPFVNLLPSIPCAPFMRQSTYIPCVLFAPLVCNWYYYLEPLSAPPAPVGWTNLLTTTSQSASVILFPCVRYFKMSAIWPTKGERQITVCPSRREWFSGLDSWVDGRKKSPARSTCHPLPQTIKG